MFFIWISCNLQDKLHDFSFKSLIFTVNSLRTLQTYYWSIMSSVGSSAQPFRVLISYVRNEAEDLARRLKQELLGFQFDVFLDVDEIKGGQDWVRALNNAVLNCHLFVPLITPEYGEKKWTRRELSLADIKDKLIIPINFLDNWLVLYHDHLFP